MDKNCINCGNGCLSDTLDKCVQWTGPDIECVGIESGMYYDEAVTNLANELCSFIEKTVDLKCLYDNTCSSCDIEVEIPKAVQIIIDKLCTLSSSDISYDGPLYCIGNNSVSGDAALFLGRSFNYNVNTGGNNTVFTYDLSESCRNLPDSYSLGSSRVVVTGSKLTSSSAIVGRSTSEVGSITIPYNSFPVNVDLEMNLQGENGVISLQKTLSLSTASAGMRYEIFDVKDYTSTSNRVLTQEVFNQLVAAQVCDNKKRLDLLNGLQAEVSSLKALVETLCDKVEELETVTINKEIDSCGGTVTVTGTPQDVFTDITNDINGIQTKITNIDTFGCSSGDCEP